MRGASPIALQQAAAGALLLCTQSAELYCTHVLRTAPPAEYRPSDPEIIDLLSRDPAKDPMQHPFSEWR